MVVAAVAAWTSPESALGSFSANVDTLSAVPASPTLTGDKTVSTKTAPAQNARRKLSFSQNSTETEHEQLTVEICLNCLQPTTKSKNQKSLQSMQCHILHYNIQGIEYLFLKTNFNIITVTACLTISNKYKLSKLKKCKIVLKPSQIYFSNKIS